MKGTQFLKFIAVVMLLAFSTVARSEYTCNTDGYITTIGNEVVAQEMSSSSGSYVRYYFATLRCRVTNSSTNDGVVERIIFTELT
ncbi:hypothetical protein [Thiohalophilus sp.]|uniref:hypothetical protein n=1 Tax=Thiohalophilus sp. TaxID=3028392 RepID=UPI002ACE7022|nr:hypothetical protein [Thiohalophilus sp.]MDZ7662428.1 hypothetical protein [Thiohalophilus sp.]